MKRIVVMTGLIASFSLGCADNQRTSPSAPSSQTGSSSGPLATRAAQTVEADTIGRAETVALGKLAQLAGTSPPSEQPPSSGPSPASRSPFGPGQHRVGSDIVAGRYFSVPRRGCFWERLSGFSGTLNDTIANEFIGFDAGQWIVDIKASDRAFSTDAECGTWFPGRRGNIKQTITPGIWLVGPQIAPGTYRANAQRGCFWQRLRSFTGRTSESTIANDFVGTAGIQRVTISSSDKGFESDDDCGTWTRVSGVAPDPTGPTRQQSLQELSGNWERNRGRR